MASDAQVVEETQREVLKRQALKKLAMQKLQGGNVNVMRESTGNVISAPASLNSASVEYLDDVQNNGKKSGNYMGLQALRGFASFPAATPQIIASQAIRDAELFKETFDGEFGIADIGNILNPFTTTASGSKRASIANLQSALGFETDDNVLQNENLLKAGQDLLQSNRKFLKESRLVKEEGDNFAFDVGSGFGSVSTSVGLTFLSKNPTLATGLFAESQRSQAYIEAREKGWDADDSRAISNVMGIAEGAIEYIGGKVFLDAVGVDKAIKRIILRSTNEAAQEAAQTGAEEIITQTSGLREKDVQGALERVAYSAAIGFIVSAPINTVVTRAENRAKELGLSEEGAKAFAQSLENNQAEIKKAGEDILYNESSPVAKDEKAQAETAQVIQKYISGEDIVLPESQVDEKLEGLDAIENKGMIPVPKRVETIGDFLIRNGGLSLSDETMSGELRTFTKKQNPELRGVAKKTGKLKLDQALEMAIEEGFISAPDPNNPTDVDINTLLEAIENQDVRESDIGLAMDRDQILEFNSQQDEINHEISSRTKGFDTVRQAFRTGVTAAKKDVKAVQTSIIKALDEAKLRPEDKAKFIKKIKNTQTNKQLKKALPDIEEKVLDLLDADLKRTLRSKIKKTISKAKKSKNAAVDIVEQIKVLEDDLTKTGVLGSGIKETPISDFQEAFIRAKLLTAKAETKLAVNKALKEARFNQRIENLLEDSVKLSNIELSKAGLGERLSVVDSFKNIFKEGMNRAQRLNINKNSMDVIFDIMDGYKNYSGANSRVFKKTIDRSYNNYLQLKEETTRAVKDLQDRLKLKGTNYERIGAYAALQQESGEQKLKSSGVKQSEIDSLVLNDAEMQMYNLMREKLDSLRPAIKEVMRVAYNKDFSNVKNYFPFMTDFKGMKDFEIQDMVGDDVLEISDPKSEFNKKDVKKGFTKERVGGNQKIRIDAMSVFLNHVDNATYLIGLGQDIKELGELAQSSDFRDVAGDLGQEITADWINLLARKGRTGEEIPALDALRVNTGAAVLGFKLSSALIQPTALMDGASFVGGSYISRGIVNVTQKEWRQFMKKNMPEIRNRVGDDPNYIDMGGDSLLAKQRQAGFWALQRLDLMSASAVASGAYVKSVEQRGGTVDLSNPDPLAIEEAQLAVRRTQSSAFAKDAAPIISQGKLTGNISVDKIILQFQSFMFNRWSLIQHDFYNAGVRQGKTAQAVNIATWLILANVGERYIRHYTKELVAQLTGAELPEDDETDQDKAIKQLLSNVPFVSSFVSSAEYGSVPVPSISMYESVAESLSYAQKSQSEDKKQKHYTNAAIQGLGTLFGISGTLQAKQFSQSLFNSTSEKKPDRTKRRSRSSSQRRSSRDNN